MRRFIGYLVLVLTILALALFDLQPQLSKLHKGLEIDGGYEIAYKVESDSNFIEQDLNEIAKEIGDKLEKSGVKNYTVSAESDENTDAGYSQVRISMGADSTLALENSLRYIESTSTITVSTLDNSGKECFLKRGSAQVKYANGTPYVEIKIDGKDDWETLKTDSETAYKKWMEDSGQDNSESEISGIMIIWMNKTETDSYTAAIEDTPEGIKVKEKILTVVPTNYYYPDEEIIKIASWGVGQNTEGFTSGSAHAVERILNGTEASYSVQRLYIKKIDATGSSYLFLICEIAFAAITLGSVIFLFSKYGINALTGLVGIVFSDVATLLFFNFFSYTFTSMSFLGMICGTIVQLVMFVNFYDKFKNELYKGRSAVKANVEAWKQSAITFFDVTVISLLITIVSTYVATKEIRLMPTMIITITLVGFIVDSLLVRFATPWLCNSKIGEKKNLFAVNSKDIPDVNKMESQTKFNKLAKMDVKKHAKGSFIGACVASGASIIAVVTLFVVSLFTNVPTFNYSSEFNTYGRIEIITEVQGILEDKKDVNKFLEDSAVNVKTNGVSIAVDKDVVVEGKEDTVDKIYYISITCENQITDSETMNKIKNQLNNLDSEAKIYFTHVEPINPTYKVRNTIALISLFAALAVGYVAIRFKYTYAFGTLATLIPTGSIFLGLAALTRIPVNTSALTGVLIGVFVTAIAQIPLYNRIKKVKQDSKVKIVTPDQREEVIVTAAHESLNTVITISIISTIVLVALALALPLYLKVCLLGASISSLIGLFSNLYVLTPVIIFADRKFSIRKTKNPEKAKKKLKAKAKKQRTAAREVEEAIIPGIND